MRIQCLTETPQTRPLKPDETRSGAIRFGGGRDGPDGAGLPVRHEEELLAFNADVARIFGSDASSAVVARRRSVFLFSQRQAGPSDRAQPRASTFIIIAPICAAIRVMSGR
jgi:hypothetical protein